MASADALPNLELLKKPYDAEMNAEAPAVFKARFETTKGDFVMEVHRDWSPRGADRFYNLVRNGWYDGVRIHRVLEDFTAGFGIHDDPYVNAVWRDRPIEDDPRADDQLSAYYETSVSPRERRSIERALGVE